MARGFLSGVLWGGVVGVGVSSAASIMAPQALAPMVSDMAPDVAQAPARIESASSGETGSTADRTLVTGTVAPQVPEPDADTGVELDSAALTSPAQPETTAPTAMDTPTSDAVTTDVAIDGENAVVPTPQALAPMEPQEADDLAIDTAPAQPPKVEVVQDETPQQPTVDVVDEATQDALVAENAAGTETDTAAEEPPQNDIADDSEADDSEAAAETQTAALAPDVQIEPVTPPASATEQTDGPDTPPAETTVLGGSARPRIGSPAGTIGDRDTGVTIRRPSSANLGEVDDGAAEEVAVQVGTITPSDDPRPISQFAQAFEPEAGKPMMAIVLIDDGTSPVTGTAGIAALRGFPYPLSFAVDTSLNDAADRMAIYRKEGFEVLAMIDLPEGAQPSDAETAFGAILPQMTEVVGVLEGTKGGLQGSREVSDQVTSILLQTGHGLVAQLKGLNTMPKLARKNGVPADPIFRDIDSKGQTASVIRRFMDQAAFKAGQEGAVVMLGRLRPDTVSALLLWGLQDRAGKVSMAPISAVLLREE